MGQRIRDRVYAQATPHGPLIWQTDPPVMPRVPFGEDCTLNVEYDWTSECFKGRIYPYPYDDLLMYYAMNVAEMDTTLAAISRALDALKPNFDFLKVHPILWTRLGH